MQNNFTSILRKVLINIQILFVFFKIIVFFIYNLYYYCILGEFFFSKNVLVVMIIENNYINYTFFLFDEEGQLDVVEKISNDREINGIDNLTGMYFYRLKKEFYRKWVEPKYNSNSLLLNSLVGLTIIYLKGGKKIVSKQKWSKINEIM